MSESMIKALKEKRVAIGEVWSLKPCISGFSDFLMNGMGDHEWPAHEELLIEEMTHLNHYDQQITARYMLNRFVMDHETVSVNIGTILESKLDYDHKWWFIGRMHLIKGLFTKEENTRYVTWVLGLQYPEVFADADVSKRLSGHMARIFEYDDIHAGVGLYDIYDICGTRVLDPLTCVYISRSCRRTDHPLSDWAEDAIQCLFDLLT